MIANLLFEELRSSFQYFYFGSATDMSNFYVDRVITITGSVDGCSKAEALLSEKMRKCLDQDAQSYNVSHYQTCR